MTTREGATEDDADDFVEHLFTASTHDYLMFFTKTGRCYVKRVYEIPERSRTSKGRSIVNFLELRPDEKIAATIRVEACAVRCGGDRRRAGGGSDGDCATAVEAAAAAEPEATVAAGEGESSRGESSWRRPIQPPRLLDAHVVFATRRGMVKKTIAGRRSATSARGA